MSRNLSLKADEIYRIKMISKDFLKEFTKSNFFFACLEYLIPVFRRLINHDELSTHTQIQMV